MEDGCKIECMKERRRAFIGIGNGVQLGFILAAKVKMARGGCDLSRRVVASSGQLRPATACCGKLQLATSGYGWPKAGYGWPGMAATG